MKCMIRLTRLENEVAHLFIDTKTLQKAKRNLGGVCADRVVAGKGVVENDK
jgi:hypothetical protein